MKIRLVLGVAALALAAGSFQATIPTAVAKESVAKKPRFGTWGFDMTAIDKATKPGDDFFRYANGGWSDRTEIAADRTSAGVAVDLVNQAEKDVLAIVEDLAKSKPKAGSIGQKVGDAYGSWMDEAAIEKAGTAPLKPYLDAIWAVNDKAGLTKLFATTGYDSPIGAGPLPDPADPTRYTVAVGQGGLGLPDRDYYFLEGEKYDSIRDAYKAYIVTQLTNAGIADASTKATAIYELEKQIATAHWAKEKNRDLKAIYNPMPLEKVAELAPSFDWNLFLTTSRLNGQPSYMVAQPSAIADIAKLIDTVPLQTWKDYSAFHFISGHSNFLPKAFDQASFEFYNKKLNGQPEQRARWKRGISLLNGSMGEAIGQIYVERHYPPESNAQMQELVSNLTSAFKGRLEKLEWMDDATRTEALAKLAAFEPRVGYPKKWIDYSALNIKRGDLLGNAMRTSKFGEDLSISYLSKPVDRDLWAMTPQTVNAYYHPLLNQITFPAAILQAPYFDPNADPAVNYGAIGAVIGHEIGHGFDDQGRSTDAAGRIRDWWTPETNEKFTKATTMLEAQYNAFEPLPGLHVNGKLTMGENIGDLGGLQMAYEAYQIYQSKHGKAPVIDGLTGDQRFFLAFGQAWRGKSRDEALRTQVLTDPHSPRMYRVNGVLRNFDAWYTAFNVQPGDKMYLPPEERVRIW